MQQKLPNILITAVNGDIGSAAVRALQSEPCKIFGCDMTKDCPVTDILDEFYEICGAAEEVHYFQELNHIILEQDIDYLLPISEPEIATINRHIGEIRLAPDRLMINNPFIIDTFLNKLSTIHYLESIGVRVPQTFPYSEFNDQLEFPVVVKQIRGCGSKNNYLVKSRDEFCQLSASLDDSWIVQEYIGTPEDEFTTGIFSDGHHTASITFKRKLGYGGLSVEARYVKSPELDRLSEKIAKHLHLVGSINLQTRKSGNLYIPFEINPRLSSTLMFRKKFGFDDAVWWLNTLTGKEYEYIPQYTSGRAVRVLSEKYFDLKPCE